MIIKTLLIDVKSRFGKWYGTREWVSRQQWLAEINSVYYPRLARTTCVAFAVATCSVH